MKIMNFIKHNIISLLLLLNAASFIKIYTSFLAYDINDSKSEPWSCENFAIGGSCPLAMTIFEIVIYVASISAVIIGLFYFRRRPILSQQLFLVPLSYAFLILPFFI